MSTTTATDRYRALFRRVLEFIDAHLDEPLTVARLSEVAAFSQYHFHRQFSGFLGVGVHRYLNLLRMKRASYQLAFRADQSVMDIALASGYEGPEAFARAFRKTLAQSPTEFRKAPQWAPWHGVFQPLSELRSEQVIGTGGPREVNIVQFPETRVAVLEHRGDPRLIGDTIRRFIEWRRAARLHPSVSATYNFLYDDPDHTPPHDYRCDLAVATGQDLTGNPYGLIGKIIPAGRCARLHHVGSDDALRVAVAHLYAQWLPQSGEEPRDFPLFVQRIRFFPDVPEHEAVTDVFLPLAG